MTAYRTITNRVRHEPDKTKGSRHIATIDPISTEDEVGTSLAALRAEFPAANHHAYAWRLGPAGQRFFCSDDGEPSGSAGRPILQHLEGRNVTNLVLVVSRIFGGTKLGVGGLVRAYGGAAASALDSAEIVTVVTKARLTLVYPYECTNAIQALVHAHETRTLASDYGEQVTLVLEVLESEADEIERKARDATAGAASIRVEQLD